MIKKSMLAIIMTLALLAGASAQITVPNTFVPGTSISSSAMNANFDTLEADALNRTNGTITGNITVSSGVTIDGIDVGAMLGGTGNATFASITVSGVALVGSDGRINGPLSTTIIDDLSGVNLTSLNASNLASGTVDTARLGSGTANSSSFLRGDSTWATQTGVGKHAVTAFRSGNQGTFGAGGEAIAFNGTDDIDTDAYHDPASNNTRITIPALLGGLYMVNVSMSASSASGFGMSVIVKKNGSTNYSGIGHYAEAQTKNVSFSFPMDLIAGDYIEVFVFDDDSVVINTVRFSATLIGQ